MIEIIKDIDLIDEFEKYDVILIGTNLYHAMSNGFQRKIKFKVPDTYQLNLSTKYGDIKKLGTIVYTNYKPIFVLCFITKGYNFRPDLQPDYLEYEELEKCIKEVNIKFKGLNIATTMIGCSNFDGNGNIEKVRNILDDNTKDINLFIYDYEQIRYQVETTINYLNIVKNKNYDKKMKMEIFNSIEDKDSPIENLDKRIKRIKKEIKDILVKK